jgi:hypothetical protein
MESSHDAEAKAKSWYAAVRSSTQRYKVWLQGSIQATAGYKVQLVLVSL